MSVTLRNGSSSAVQGDGHVRLHVFTAVQWQSKKGRSTPCALHLLPGDSVQMTLPYPDGSDGIVAYAMSLWTVGLSWDSPVQATWTSPGSPAVSLQVVPGGTYTIVDDLQNPALSQEEREAMTKMVFREMEHLTPFRNIYSRVYDACSFKGTRTLEQLLRVYSNGSGIHLRWTDLYEPCQIETWASRQEVHDALAIGSEARIALYWRALDRYPGGNSDFQTVCYRYVLARAEDRRCIQWSNWDGSPVLCSYRPLPGLAELGGLFEALKAMPIADSECSAMVEQNYRDEYDSEWTSQEILVFLPRVWRPATHSFFDVATQAAVRTLLLVSRRLQPKLPRDILHHIFRFVCLVEYVPVMRLHRYLIGDGPDLPCTQEQARVFDAADAAVGMGRVNTFTDAGDGQAPCRAAQDPKEDAKHWRPPYSMHFPYVQPIYLGRGRE